MCSGWLCSSGLTGKQVSIGIFEVALNIGYVGLFLMVVFYYLSKADLIPSKHPYFKESLDYLKPKA